MARELGKAIQTDKRYIAYMLATQQCDEDKELQEKISVFSLSRERLNEELSKDEPDKKAVSAINDEIKEIYRGIMQNQNKADQNEAMTRLREMHGFITQIISGSMQGLDPDTIEYSESCGGDCGGCSGCGS